jgi:hypothetical protein
MSPIFMNDSEAPPSAHPPNCTERLVKEP